MLINPPSYIIPPLRVVPSLIKSPLNDRRRLIRFPIYPHTISLLRSLPKKFAAGAEALTKRQRHQSRGRQLYVVLQTGLAQPDHYGFDGFLCARVRDIDGGVAR